MTMRLAMIVREASKRSLVPPQQRVPLVHEGLNNGDDEDDAQRMAQALSNDDNHEGVGARTKDQIGAP